MTRISEKDWGELTRSKGEFNKQKRDMLNKFVVSFFMLILFLVYSNYADLEGEKTFIYLTLPFTIIGAFSSWFLKKMNQLNLMIFSTMYVFITLAAYYAIILTPEIRALVIFMGLAVIYLYELEKKAWNKWLILVFSAYVGILILFLPYDLFIRGSMLLLILFITGLVYSGNDLRAELMTLRRNKKSYEVFFQHTRHLEHHVINSITKLMYVKEMLKEKKLMNSDDETNDLIDLLDQEIDHIESIITKTDKSDLKNFDGK